MDARAIKSLLFQSGETRDKLVIPHRKHLLRRSQGRHPSLLDEADTVAEFEKITEIVSDDDAGDAGVPETVAKFFPHRSLSPHIDGGERFIEEEEFGIEHQRPGEGNSLPLPTRKPGDVDVRKIGKVHRAELLRYDSGYLGFGDLSAP